MHIIIQGMYSTLYMGVNVLSFKTNTFVYNKITLLYMKITLSLKNNNFIFENNFKFSLNIDDFVCVTNIIIQYVTAKCVYRISQQVYLQKIKLIKFISQ